MSLPDIAVVIPAYKVSAHIKEVILDMLSLSMISAPNLQGGKQSACRKRTWLSSIMGRMKG